MGLDMYAFVNLAPLAQVAFEPDDANEQVNYWRKHPDLHGWLERLYCEKAGAVECFNSVAVALTEVDPDALGADPATMRSRRPPASSSGSLSRQTWWTIFPSWPRHVVRSERAKASTTPLGGRRWGRADKRGEGVGTDQSGCWQTRRRSDLPSCQRQRSYGVLGHPGRRLVRDQGRGL